MATGGSRSGAAGSPLGVGTWLVAGEHAAEAVREGRAVAPRDRERALRWIGESRFEISAFDLGEPERDESEFFPTDVRTVNPPWARV
jgi:hypothetical protein